MQVAPKAYCYDCGKYVGRRWGDKKVHLCGACLDKLQKKTGERPKTKDDIPY